MVQEQRVSLQGERWSALSTDKMKTLQMGNERSHVWTAKKDVFVIDNRRYARNVISCEV